MKRTLLAAAAVALGLAVAAPAAAQQVGPGMGHGMGHGMMGQGMGNGPMMRDGVRMAHGGMMGGRMMGRMCENRDARIAGMLAYAKEKLDITQAQEPAWSRFAEAARASQAPVDQACAALAGGTQGEAQTLPQRLERMQAMVSAHAAQFEQLLPAVKTLYDQLTPEQKAIADSMMQHGPRGFGPRGG